jgi:hypothetical protein
MAKKKGVKVGPQYPMVVETFRELNNYQVAEWERDNVPSCFNGYVNVTRYRITIEKVVEPVEVIWERLRKLWRESDNMHHYQPLKVVAARYGLELNPTELGKDRKRGN